MFLLRGIECTYEAVRDWEAKLAPLLMTIFAAAAVVAVGSATRGTWMKPTSRSMADGAIYTERSTAPALWWT